MASKVMRDDPLRQQVELLLGRELSNEQWAVLDDLELAMDCRHGRANLNELFNWVRRWLKATAGSRPQTEASEHIPRDKSRYASRALRGDALRILLAQLAEAEPEVQRFRSEVLGGKLLPPETAIEWVPREGRLEGLPTIWLDSIPLPHEAKLVRREDGFHVDPPLVSTGLRVCRYRVETLEITCPPDFQVHRHAVEEGGVLDRLRRISEDLAKDYQWSKADAAAFLLTGSAPYYSSAKITRTVSSDLALVGTRLTFVLDPTLSPSEVADIYATWRKTLLTKRYRPLSEKHLTLVRFLLERPAGETWRDHMSAWNKEYGRKRGWSYSQETNFRRDFHRAKRRMLFPGFAGLEGVLEQNEPEDTK